MRISQEMVAGFAPSLPRPVFAVLPLSLAAAVPTAMVLVDYALAGLGTPTAGVQAYAAAMPDSLVAESHPVRAVLAHGTVLRDVVYAQIPAGHPAHREWPALREWLLRCGDERIDGLVDHGLDCLAAYDSRDADVRHPGEVTGPRAPLARRRQEVVAALKGWGVAGAPQRATEVLDAGRVRRVLVALLDHIWDGWLAEAVAVLPEGGDQNAAPPAFSTVFTASQWVAWATGFRPDKDYAATLDAARGVSVMPCPGLGQSLSLFGAGDEAVVLYSPQRGAAQAQGTPGVSLASLGSFGRVMRALGDPTRLAIVLQLLARGPLTMSDLAGSLDVHQSTISRQVAALRTAGLVADDAQRRLLASRDLVRQAADQLGRLASDDDE